MFARGSASCRRIGPSRRQALQRSGRDLQAKPPTDWRLFSRLGARHCMRPPLSPWAKMMMMLIIMMRASDCRASDTGWADTLSIGSGQPQARLGVREAYRSKLLPGQTVLDAETGAQSDRQAGRKGRPLLWAPSCRLSSLLTSRAPTGELISASMGASGGREVWWS